MSNPRVSTHVSHTLGAFAGQAKLFASIHLDGRVPDALVQLMADLPATAYEVYSHQLRPPALICSKMQALCERERPLFGNFQEMCETFFPQYEGIRRAYRMKQEHEESGATRFTQVLRIRWDAMCEVPAIHQLARLIHSAHGWKIKRALASVSEINIS